MWMDPGQPPVESKGTSESKAILEREIIAQSFDDGCTREQAIGYQFFVLQFFLATALVGDASNNAFSVEYRQRFQSMSRFLLDLSDGGPIPHFGDCDDGYVLDLGDNDDRPSVVACMARAMDGTNPPTIPRPCETGFWLGENGAQGNDAALPQLTSRAFTSSGYYLLQSSTPGRPSVVFDCGPLGYTNIAAHGHADALSLVFRIDGMDVLVDPGTYDYFTYPQWRNYFRSTRAHNTVEIDGVDQSIMNGPFMWDKHATSTCDDFLPAADGGRVVAHHDGYLRLDDPVLHTRTVQLGQHRLSIEDTLSCAASHNVALMFHFSPNCTVEAKGSHEISIQLSGRRLAMQLPGSLTVELVRGGEYLGWYSGGYHSKKPTVTLIARGDIHGKTVFGTVLDWA